MNRIDKQHSKAALREWIQLITQLADETEEWAVAENWSTFRDMKPMHEDRCGTYKAPVVRIRSVAGEVWLDPVGRDIVGADGRVDLFAWPSLDRFKLVRREGDWQIITDDNVRIRRKWSRGLFLKLVGDLTAVPV